MVVPPGPDCCPDIGLLLTNVTADPERKLFPLSPTINIPPLPSVVLDPIPSDP